MTGYITVGSCQPSSAPFPFCWEGTGAVPQEEGRQQHAASTPALLCQLKSGSLLGLESLEHAS